VSEAPDTLYEEDIKDEFNGVDEGIDSPTPVDAGVLAGDVKEDTNNMFDEYLGAEMIIDAGLEGDPLRGRVVKRAKREDGKAVGTAHSNLMRARRSVLGLKIGILLNGITMIARLLFFSETHIRGGTW